MATHVFNPRQPLTQQEKQYYDSVFHSLDPEALGIVTGEAARSTFEKSGLPPAVLGEIWQLADPTNLGFLTNNAFNIALRLIGHVQNGAKLDASLIDLTGPLANFSEPAAPAVASPLIGAPAALPPLTNNDISKFSQLFQKNAPSGIITGDQARTIFLKAKLPTTTLSTIWSLVDTANAGQLNSEQFILAMFLIQGTINGSIKALPAAIPQSYWDQARSTSIASFSPQVTGPQLSRPAPVSRVPSSFSNASSDWVISPQKKQQFDGIFDSLDKAKTGTLGPTEVANFLMTSKLSQEVLANIWDLADIYNTGEFTKNEFAIAMFLVQKKIAGFELPDVVPQSIINSLQASPVASQTQPVQPQPQPAAQPAAQPAQQKPKPQSAIADLVDLNDAFSTPSPSVSDAPTPVVEKSVAAPAPAPAAPAAPAKAPTLSYTPTGNKFVPSSSFGQDLFEKQKVATPSPPASTAIPAVVSSAGSGVASGVATGIGAAAGLAGAAVGALASTATRSVPKSSNSDLLADPEVSGQLSKATTEMANLSNQIGSLSSQTSQLHDKRQRAERELAKITQLKQDIESKLNNLRVAYDQEVKQTAQVEALLTKSKQETEDLRKQTSLVEAQFNTTQANLQSLQNELEESQKENALLKEKLGNLNAEQIESTKQMEKVQNDIRQSKGLVAITSKQVNIQQVQLSTIKEEIEKLLASSKELDQHHESIQQKQLEISQKEQDLNQRQLNYDNLLKSFEPKELELKAKLEEQQKNEAAINQHNEHLTVLFNDLKAREAELNEAEHQLQEQQIEYAKRVQEFTNKQVEDATNGFASYSKKDEAAPAEAGEAESKEVTTDVVPATQIAANKDIKTESEKDHGEFSSPETTTGHGTSVTSYDDADAATNQRSVNQYNLPVRPDSTTSSVQNNAPQSVRGDEIDITGDDVDIQEHIASVEDVLGYEENNNKSEGELTLRAPESVDDVPGGWVDSAQVPEKSAEATEQPAEATEKSAEATEKSAEATEQSVDSKGATASLVAAGAAVGSVATTVVNKVADVVAPAPVTPPAGTKPEETADNEEFPPIKELSIDESDSDEDEFHEASAPTPKSSNPKDDFDFEDLVEAKQSAGSATQAKSGDAFDEFDDLEAAEEVSFNDDEEEVLNVDQDLNDELDGNFYGEEGQEQVPEAKGNNPNEEWEEIFSGFGNVPPQAPQSPQPTQLPPAPPQPRTAHSHPYAQHTQPHQKTQPPVPAAAAAPASAKPKIATTPRELAIQELTGMGFTEQEALDALNKEKWNLEAATNYLLDNA